MTLIETVPALRATQCAICEIFGEADELYPSRSVTDALDASHFSARRVPDRAHFRIVRCRRCGLVRSDPVPPPEMLGHLYRDAAFTYGDEVVALRRTYGRYLRRLERLGASPGTFLDIGCGNGFMLEEALRLGYGDVRGVEPAESVAAAAAPAIRERIVVDLMAPGLFASESFNVVTMFQTLDHIALPNETITEISRILRPGGFVLCLNHDVRSLSARVLRAHSPIVDIEHMYLYDRRTLALLLRKHGLEPVAGGHVWNRYSLRYLAQLMPLSTAAKRSFLRLLDARRLGRISIIAPLGNLWLAARKL